ncbi:MAG: squalene synthase HpnC [Phycisphaerales bacterium]|nr:squalene synthase HpnC [Phycisphaerales bacterium]
MSVTRSERLVGLAEYGPTSARVATRAEARAWCRNLTRTHGENFSVLSALVPLDRVDDFSAVYSFCRVADDLGDEMASPQRATELLAWWRSSLQQCMRGEATHPVFVALRECVQRHDLPAEPFHDLITAFESDQIKNRYASWNEVIDYCKLSADPVGRLVLMVLGERRDALAFAASDALCTALQLTNHWQDVRRDCLERNRIYLPADSFTSERFEERLVATCRVGYAPDRTFLAQYRDAVHAQVAKTWTLFERGSELLGMLQPAHRPLIWLFLAGGTGTLRQIEAWNCETCIARPKLSKLSKLLLVGRARWWGRRAIEANKAAS